MRNKEELSIDVVRKICKAVGGQSEVARHMGKTKQLVHQMLNNHAYNKFNLSYFLEAFENMNVDKILGQRIADSADLLTKYHLIKTEE